MLMLSNLERFTVIDEKGTRAEFAEFAVALFFKYRLATTEINLLILSFGINR